MEWTELTPLSVANLNDLEARINTANQNTTDAKTPIAAAITTMGQPASGADSFALLATKIRDISKDADAAAGDVLNAKTFYQGGVKRIGTMVDRGTVNIIPSSAAQTIAGGKHSGAGTVAAVVVPVANVLTGTTIAGQAGTMPIPPSGSAPAWWGSDAGQMGVTPPAGYWDGARNIHVPLEWNAGEGVAARAVGRNGNDIWLYPSQAGYVDTNSFVYLTDNEWIEQNILLGKDILGKTGTARPVASGSGSLASQSSLTVSGLSFTPSKVVFLTWRNAGGVFYFDHFVKVGGAAPNRTVTSSNQSNGGATYGASARIASQSSDTININGGQFSVNYLDTTHTGYDWDAWA